MGLARVALREREYPATEVAEAKVVAAEAPPVAGVIDLMEALRAGEEVTKKRAAAGWSAGAPAEAAQPQR